MIRPFLLFAALLLCLAGAPAQAGLVPLDAGQRTWLAQHPQWRVGVVLQAPYAYYDRRSQQLSGANVELMAWIGRALGVELRWRHYTDPEALERAVRAGEVDLAPGLGQTPAGLRLWLFSDPYLRVAHLVVGERNGAGAVDLEKLGPGDPVALRAPGPVADYLRGTYGNLDLQATGSDRQALQRVLNRRARYAVVDEAQLSLLSRDPPFADLAVVGDVGLPNLLRIGSRRDWPMLAGIVDSALRSLPPKDLEQLQARWLKPKSPRLGDSTGFWQNLALLLGVLLAIALALGFSLRRQRHALEQQLATARQDLARREAAEEALQLTQSSLDHGPVGILWVNWDSRIRYANRAAEYMLGLGMGELVERPLAEFEPGLNMDRWLTLWRRARNREEGVLNVETEVRRADGGTLPVDVSLSFLRFRQAEYLVVFLTDVTERRRARAELGEREARLQGIAANVPGLVFRLERPYPGAPLDFAFISEGSESLVGYSPATVMAPDFGIRSLVHPDDREAYHRSQDAALESERDWHWQGRILTRDGRQRWADIRASARRLADGVVVWDGIVWDMSENKQIELALADSRAQLRELSAHLESVREEEKARIAREVHDELGQVLTVLKLETSMCELAFGALDPGLRERLDSMKRLIAHLFQLVRDVATALRPPILDAGIASAIEWQARRFEARTGIPCLVEVPEQLPVLSDAKAIGLFRVLQEALTNVMRHAEAHSVQVRLSVEDEALRLCIGDDGRGFDERVCRRGQSFGLVGMRERVLALGGRLEIDSQPGEGCLLCAWVPLTGRSAVHPSGLPAASVEPVAVGEETR